MSRNGTATKLPILVMVGVAGKALVTNSTRGWETLEAHSTTWDDSSCRTPPQQSNWSPNSRAKWGGGLWSSWGIQPGSGLDSGSTINIDYNFTRTSGKWLPDWAGQRDIWRHYSFGCDSLRLFVGKWFHSKVIIISLNNIIETVICRPQIMIIMWWRHCQE